MCVWLGGCAEKRIEEEEREEREEEERLERQRAEHAQAVARKELRQSLHWVRVHLSRARVACLRTTCPQALIAGTQRQPEGCHHVLLASTPPGYLRLSLSRLTPRLYPRGLSFRPSLRRATPAGASRPTC